MISNDASPSKGSHEASSNDRCGRFILPMQCRDGGTRSVTVLNLTYVEPGVMCCNIEKFL